MTKNLPGRNKLTWQVLVKRYLPIVFFILLVLFFTWPLVVELGSRIPGFEGDAYNHYWTCHWAGNAIKSGNFRLYTNELFYPDGVSLINHNIAWFNAIIWLLLEPFFGSAAAYTLVILLILAFNGFTIYLLAHEFTESVAASLLAGVIGTTWPYINTQLQHPNLIAVGFVPLSLIFIRRFFVDDRLENLVLSAIFIGLIGVVRLQLLFMSLILIGTFILYGLVTQKAGKNILKKLIYMGLLVAVILIPFVTPIFVRLFTQENLGDLLFNASYFQKTSLINYVLPNPNHPLWEESIRALGDVIQIPNHVSFVGYSVLAFALVGILGRRKESVLWLIGVVLIVFLADGPSYLTEGNSLFTTLFAPFFNRFLIPIIRDPERFNVILVIPMSILSAYGCHYLLLKGKSIKVICPTVAIILVIFEFLMIPFPVKRLSVPAWYTELAQEPDQFGVVDVPMERQHDEFYMLYQLVHGKSLVEGHIARPPKEAFDFIDSVPLLAYMHKKDGKLPPSGDINISQQFELLDQANIRYLILHKKFLTDDEIKFWRNWIVKDPMHEDEDLIVYDTSMAGLKEEFIQSPSISDQIQVVQSGVEPQEIIQAGWFQIETHFLLSGELEKDDNRFCIALVDSNNSVSQSNCNYKLIDESEGSETEKGLILKHYPVQVQPTTPVGEYDIVLYQPSVSNNILPEAVAPGGHLSVQPLSHSFNEPDPDVTMDISFQDEISLVGFDARQNKDSLNLILYWQALVCPAESYKVFVHIIDAETNNIVAQHDFVPGDWNYLTHQWQAGEYVWDEVSMNLSDVSAGEYLIQVGIYNPGTGVRLETKPSWPDNAVVLTRIQFD